MSAVQYMERQLLESRQLTPPLTDYQLIRKITRHYGRELEIASVTRDVRTIQNLESLISEYAMMRQKSNREDRFVRQIDKVNERDTRGVHQSQQNTAVNKVTEQKPAHWQHRKGESGNYRQFQHFGNKLTVNTIEFVNNSASTSTAKGGEVVEKKLSGSHEVIAVRRPTLQHYETDVLLPDLRQELILDEQTQLERRISKCPEIVIKFNDDVTVNALLDTGSAINGLAEEWLHRNKQRLRPYEELRMNNTLIVSAVGGKSKLIRKQIMCEIFIDNVRLDCVFLVIPNLIRVKFVNIVYGVQLRGCMIREIR